MQRNGWTALGVGLLALLVPVFSIIPTSVPNGPPGAQSKNLDSFRIEIDDVYLDAEKSDVAASAVLTTKIQLENKGMHEKKDVMLTVSLHNGLGNIVSQSTQLVYVPFNQTRTLTVSLLGRSPGLHSVIAWVSVDNQASVTSRESFAISIADLLG